MPDLGHWVRQIVVGWLIVDAISLLTLLGMASIEILRLQLIAPPARKPVERVPMRKPWAEPDTG